MLIRIWPAILRMAAQAKLVHIGGPQIVPSGPAMRIVAIHTAHLAFAQRMMIRHAELRALGRVTFQAGVVGLPHWPDDRIGFGRHRSCRDRSSGRLIESNPAFLCSSECGLVNLVTIHAAKMIGGVRPADPVPELFISRV